MALWQDINYLRQIAPRLERFKEKSTNKLWNCRCFRCGDSVKKSNKTRGYFFPSLPTPGMEECLMYKCQNCNISLPFSAILKDFDANLYSQYRLEKYRDSKPVIQVVETSFDIALAAIQKLKKTPPETRKYIPSITDDLKCIAELGSKHPATQYIKARCIPVNMWEKLFYAPKFFKWASGNTDKFKSWTDEDHPRLIIPWYSEDNVCHTYTARSFGKEEPKYYKIVLDDSYPPYYGLEKLDKTKQIYVMEGPLDALFLNAVAVGTSALQLYQNKDAIYLPDRDIRNKEIMKITNKMIQLGYRVCMLPDDLPGKDVNDFVVSGMSIKEIEAIINAHTYQGLEAQMEFLKWKKC